MTTTSLPSSFPSLAALRSAHQQLLRESSKPTKQFIGQVHAFLAAAEGTGKVLQSRTDRSAAQALLDYWVGMLFTVPTELKVSAPPEVALAEFDLQGAPDLSDKPCPFMGLNAFHAEDADRFFGREEAIDALATMVAKNRLVLVVGPSGSGKSSLVMAGLLPRLGNPKSGAGYRVLPVVVPGTDPLAALAKVRNLTGSRLASDPELLREFKETGQPDRPMLLVVDQLEELFTLCTDQTQRERFAAAVASLVADEQTGNRVILTVREDFAREVTQLAPFRALAGNASAQFSPPPMSVRELRRVVDRPAALVGLEFDEGIVDDLIREVAGEPTALPLLQFALVQLWDHRSRNRISWDVYRKVGNPRRALHQTADAVYERLIPEDQKTAERIFSELVAPATGAEFVRRRVRRETLVRLEASDRVNRVLERFVEAGLLRKTKGDEADDDRFEVAHEALIRNWPRLDRWLDEQRQRYELLHQVRAAGRLWRQNGRDPAGLIGGRVLDSVKWLAGLTAEDIEFIDACKRRREELEQKQKSDERQYHRRVMQWVIGCALGAAVPALFFGGCAMVGCHQAGVERDRARGLATYASHKEQVALAEKKKAEEELKKREAEELRREKAEKDLNTEKGRADVNQQTATRSSRYVAETPWIAQRKSVEISNFENGWGLWTPGRTIRIRFMGGSKELHKRVRDVASTWIQGTSIVFDWVQSADNSFDARLTQSNPILPRDSATVSAATQRYLGSSVFAATPNALFVDSQKTPLGSNEQEIRVSFVPNFGVWSFRGTDALQVPPGQATMNLGNVAEIPPGPEFNHIVLYCFGLTLGLLSELNLPSAMTQQLDFSQLYEIYKLPVSGWSEVEVNRRFKPYLSKQVPWYDKAGAAGVFDPESAMMPPRASLQPIGLSAFYPPILKSGVPRVGGEPLELKSIGVLSSANRQLIKFLYPAPSVVELAMGKGNILGFRHICRFTFNVKQRERLVASFSGLPIPGQITLRDLKNPRNDREPILLDERDRRVTYVLTDGRYSFDVMSLNLNQSPNMQVTVVRESPDK